MVLRVSIEEISCKFRDGVETEIYGPLVKFLEDEFGPKTEFRMEVEPNKPLILKVTAFLEKLSLPRIGYVQPYLGYSGSDADVVMYPKQEAVGIREDDPLLRKSGQYALRNSKGIIYPSVVIQVITGKSRTGKLHLENMKAQDWRSMFPRALLVLLAGGEYDTRYDRDTYYFGLVLSDLSNLESCRSNLKVLCDTIHSHLDAKW